MVNEFNNIIYKEQSVKAPVIHDIIQIEVKDELHNMKNKITTLQRKYDQTNSKLTHLKPATDNNNISSA